MIERLRSQRRLVIAAVATVTAAFLDGTTARGADEDRFQSQVRPFLQQYCADCHGPDDPAGGVALDLTHDPSAPADTWFRALAAVESHVMPPADATQPTAVERQRLIEWIEKDYAAEQCGRAVSIAPVVMRRLNREEYNNTIRDLVGLDLRPADDFPPDEMSFGFDNIGSALTISPSHLEKYLDGAERVATALIPLPNADEPSPLELVGLQPYDLKPAAPVEFAHPFAAGTYLADLTLLGRFDETAPPLLTIGIGADRRTVESIVVQGNAATYRLWLTVGEGQQPVTVALTEGPREAEATAEAPKEAPAEGESEYRRGERGWTIESIVVRGPCPSAPLPEAAQRLFVSMPKPGERTREESAAAILDQLMERAFRRPLRDGERDRVLDLFRMADRRGESFERSMQVAVIAVLVSPQFLFLVEPEESSASRPLTEYELASRLSYFLWSSLPDDELLRDARGGTLRQNLKAQVRRMLADPKSIALTRNLTGQWLQLRRLEGVEPDRKLFPEFDDSLRQSMRGETEQFVDDLIRNDRRALDLIEADYTFLNARLARHYGIEGVEGQTLQRVALAGDQRGGVLTQASVLTLTSNPNRTSPVKRGQWILEQILGTPPPPPPPNVPKLEEGEKAAATGSLRDRLEAHRANPECAACHQRMDPMGFALENYDAIGRWRTTDGEFPIDPAGELTDGRAFANPAELKRALVAQPKSFTRSLIRNLLTLALGRGLESSDWCTVEAIRGRLEADNGRIGAILEGIVESEAFQSRGVLPAPAVSFLK